AHTFRWSVGSAGPLRGKKTQLWEGGVRVPFIVRLPKRVPAGRVNEAVASALDFLPTVCELAGVKAPPPKERDEGISRGPLLTGKGAAQKRTLYWEFHGGQRGGPESGSLAMRDGDWKLYVYPNTPKRELYNLQKDPGEKDNVIAQHKELAGQMEARALK